MDGSTTSTRQSHRALFGLRAALALAGLFAVAGALLFAFARDGAPDARPALASGTVTPSYNCSVDPSKPCPDGNLSGTYDVVVYGSNKGDTVYHCIVRTDHETSTNDIKLAAVCAGEVDTLSDPNNALLGIDVPGEGVDGNPGPPPPGPYSALPVGKGIGKYLPSGGTWNPPGGNPNAYNCPDTDPCWIGLACFTRLGATALGENVLAAVVMEDPKAQLGASGKQEGWTLFEIGHTNNDCRAFNGNGHTGAYPATNVNFHPADDKNPLCAPDCDLVSWRDSDQRAPDGRVDWDGDGCSDFQELDKTGQYKCGDDPWNPYDSNTTDFSGPYTILVEGIEADTSVPGAYLHCIVEMEQTGTGQNNGDLVAPAYCYIDSPLFDVNDDAFPGQVGDGYPGAAPPGPKVTGIGEVWGTWVFGDVGSTHIKFSGRLNSGTNDIELTGCLSTVYAEASIGAHNGEGEVDLFLNQDPVDCATGAPFGQYASTYSVTPDFGDAPLFAARQAPGSQSAGPARDTDQDGCPDKDELVDANVDPLHGGRDPYNPFDRYDVAGAGGSPTPDGVIDLSNDILGVILNYSPSGYAANPERVRFDRAPDTTTGAGHWNRFGGDGVIDLANDILGVILQYDPSGCPSP